MTTPIAIALGVAATAGLAFHLPFLGMTHNAHRLILYTGAGGVWGGGVLYGLGPQPVVEMSGGYGLRVGVWELRAQMDWQGYWPRGTASSRLNLLSGYSVRALMTF